MSPQTNTTRNYYDVLGVPPTATESEIHRALREKWRVEDSVGAQAAKLNPKEARRLRANLEQKSREITEAYAVLSDARKRKDYDDFLRRSQPASAEEELPVPSKVRRVRFLVWGITSGIIIVSIYFGFPQGIPDDMWEIPIVVFIFIAILRIKIVGPPYGPLDGGDAVDGLAFLVLLLFVYLLFDALSRLAQ